MSEIPFGGNIVVVVIGFSRSVSPDPDHQGDIVVSQSVVYVADLA